MTSNYDLSELRKLRIWIAAGAIGLLLTGIGMVASLGVLAEISDMAEESQSASANTGNGFANTASELYDTGKLNELESTIATRHATRPNDGEVYWWKARLLVAKGAYTEALEQLDIVQLHSPTWTKEYIDPLRDAIDRAPADSK